MKAWLFLAFVGGLTVGVVSTVGFLLIATRHL